MSGDGMSVCVGGCLTTMDALSCSLNFISSIPLIGGYADNNFSNMEGSLWEWVIS